MNVLISNDDGIFAQGIQALANALAKAGHQVTVVCPDRERSATGHGLTLHKPIRAERIESVFHETVDAWACSGTPSDCVKLALGAILDEPPDLVCSGINHGANLGTDVLYSGTVSAAMEGVIEGIPSIAFSLTSFAHRDFQPAAEFAVELVGAIAQQPMAQLALLNVNIPAVARDEIAGVVVTRQGVRRYIDLFEKRTDPRGKTYYWLAGEVVEDGEDTLTLERGGLKEQICDRPPQNSYRFDTDVQAIRQNFITITPLQYNLTCGAGLEHLHPWASDRQWLQS